MKYSGKTVTMSGILSLWLLGVSGFASIMPQPARLFVELPDYCPTPDAFALAPDGSVTLSCPNYADASKPGVLVKLTRDGTVSRMTEIPGMTAGSKARPMGLTYAPDGALFVCANQGGKEGGLLLRLTFKDGTIDTREVVAHGMQGPNGLKFHDGSLYVTQPSLPRFNTEQLTSGVYQFKDSDRDIKINNDSTDTNLIFTVQTQNPDRQFGLDGLTFDRDGTLLVGDFGDGIIYRLKLDTEGRVSDQSVYARLPDTAGIDGMDMDGKGNLYVAGFSQNQIWKVDADGRSSVIAHYPDNNGADGDLDQPSDLIIVGDRLLIANFDLMVQPGMVNRAHGKPYTVSFIDLAEVGAE